MTDKKIKKTKKTTMKQKQDVKQTVIIKIGADGKIKKVRKKRGPNKKKAARTSATSSEASRPQQIIYQQGSGGAVQFENLSKQLSDFMSRPLMTNQQTMAAPASVMERQTLAPSVDTSLSRKTLIAEPKPEVVGTVQTARQSLKRPVMVEKKPDEDADDV